MSRSTFIATGSTTLVKTGPGYLYGVHISPANGASLVTIDSLTTSNTGVDFNANVTGMISRDGLWATTVPDFVPFYGVRFDNGLTVAASSSARLTVLTD